jgi:hypothetical protein
LLKSPDDLLLPRCLDLDLDPEEKQNSISKARGANRCVHQPEQVAEQF